MENQHNNLWPLIARYLSGEATESEKEILQTARETDSEMASLIHEAENIWQDTATSLIINNTDTDLAWKKIKPQLQKSAPRIIANWMKIAAVGVILLATSIFVQFYFFQPDAKNLIVMSSGDQPIQLADGTQIEINKNTQLTYPDKFEESQRNVVLNGEAFFNVAKNPNKPFVITSNQVKIKVLGTSFNVKSYASENKTEVVVATGKVEVWSIDHPEMKILLLPGEKGLFENNNLVKSTNSNPNFLAWKTKQIKFANTSLFDACQTVQEVYNIEIVLATNNLNELQITADFDKQSPEFILKVMAMTFDLKMKQEGNHYILSR